MRSFDLEARLGGVCLLRGCIPSKTLLHVAKAMAEAKHLARCGVAFAPPAIDLGSLRAYKEKVIATLTGGLKQLSAKRKVGVVRGRARFESSQTLKVEPIDGQPLPDDRIDFEHCIVATGSSPARIAAFDLPTHRIMDSSGALELPDVPESLLVVGGGYIGLEMGVVYAALGSRVSVVEMTDGLLPGADRDLVRPLHKKLQGDFAGIYLSAKVAALADKKDSIEVTFEGDVPERVQRFSRVLLSVGRRPNSADLGLENTAVEVDAQGFLAVDLQRRTADPHILAIGDVAGQPMLAHKASHEGKVGGRGARRQDGGVRAAGHSRRGLHRSRDRLGRTDRDRGQVHGSAVEVAQFPWAASGRAQAIGRTEGLTKWIVDPNAPAGLRHRRGRGGRFDQRSRPGDRNGLLGPRPGRDDSSAPDAQRNARLRGRGATGPGDRSLPAEAKRIKRPKAQKLARRQARISRCRSLARASG